MAVESKLHTVIGSDLDDETLSVDPSAVSTLPVTNLQVQGRARLMRVSGTSATITASNSGGIAKVASGFGLGHHNLLSDATVRLRLYAGESQTGTVNYDSGNVSVSTIIPWGVFRIGVDKVGATYEDSTNLPQIFHHWFESTAYKSIQVDISAASNSTIDISRIFLGSAFVPINNYSFGSVFEWVDESKQVRTAGGSLRTLASLRHRRYEFSLNWLSSSEREKLSTSLEESGKSGDILMSLNPNDTGATRLEYTAIVKLIDNHKYTRALANSNRATFVFEEV